MSEALRLYKYKSMLSSRRAMSAADLMAGEGISPATFKRDMAKMRDQMRMPIRFDRDLGGYILDKDSGDSRRAASNPTAATSCRRPIQTTAGSWATS